ncbi:MAG: ABC transporter ATP-binding protein/permease [Clostridiales bacterium]|nr:ABC transporter ATP-binding protein/permease [Clostridiales bacterium]
MFKYMKKYLPFAFLAPLFMFGEVSMDLIQPALMKVIVDEGVLGLSNGGTGSLELVITTGIKMVLWVIFGGFCGVVSGVFANLCSQNFSNDLRKDCFKRTMELSFSQTDKFSTGSIVTRITNDVTQLQNLVTQMVRGFVRTGLLIIGGTVCLIYLDLSFGVVVLCGLPFILFMVIFFMMRANPIFTLLQNKLDNVNNVMQENITGVRVVKAYVKEDYEKNRFGKANRELVDTQLHVLELFAYMTPLMNIVLNASIVAVIYMGGLRSQIGDVTPGAVMAAVTYISQILHAVMRTTMIFQTASRGIASGKRLKEILDCSPEIKDGSFEGETKTRGKIEFRNVSFGYGEKDILKDINLTINPGETIGVLGATGCGKSSLAKLIPRFYDTTGGSVLIDDIDVRDYKLKALRDKVSIALQKSEIFNVSVKENILWGKSSAGRDEVIKAAEAAQAKEFIDRMEQGFDTPIAEKGMSLSGGQKQRIAISRCILKKGEILVFDDTTSALDLKTEAKLYKALAETCGDVTKIIIAQRIASVKDADRIVVLDKGHIAACGSHRELVETSGIYRDIYDSQLKAG